MKLIEKTRESAIRIKNEEVILLIGRTGAGKSTTTHFLAGSEMEKIKIYFDG
jgi:flagellar biosynthesis GTPase FlhF